MISSISPFVHRMKSLFRLSYGRKREEVRTAGEHIIWNVNSNRIDANNISFYDSHVEMPQNYS
jgi:hypothetical protein